MQIFYRPEALLSPKQWSQTTEGILSILNGIQRYFKYVLPSWSVVSRVRLLVSGWSCAWRRVCLFTTYTTWRYCTGSVTLRWTLAESALCRRAAPAPTDISHTRAASTSARSKSSTLSPWSVHFHHTHTHSLSLSVSVLVAISPGEPGLVGFIGATDDGSSGDNWSYKSCAKLQSNRHHQQTDIQFFTGRMPFLSPNQQCQSTEEKMPHFTDLLTPELQLCLWPLIAPGYLGEGSDASHQSSKCEYPNFAPYSASV